MNTAFKQQYLFAASAHLICKLLDKQINDHPLTYPNLL